MIFEKSIQGFEQDIYAVCMTDADAAEKNVLYRHMLFVETDAPAEFGFLFWCSVMSPVSCHVHGCRWLLNKEKKMWCDDDTVILVI